MPDQQGNPQRNDYNGRRGFHEKGIRHLFSPSFVGMRFWVTVSAYVTKSFTTPASISASRQAA